jgi:hypothetical protein
MPYYKKKSISPALPQGYRLISLAWLTNQNTGLAKIFHSSKIYLNINYKISVSTNIYIYDNSVSTKIYMIVL